MMQVLWRKHVLWHQIMSQDQSFHSVCFNDLAQCGVLVQAYVQL